MKSSVMMKSSLRSDEIAVAEGGFNFICEADFIRALLGFHHTMCDFIAKLQIAWKECFETEYWIEIAQNAGLISNEIAKNILHDCGSIRRMLISSTNTAKQNTQ